MCSKVVALCSQSAEKLFINQFIKYLLIKLFDLMLLKFFESAVSILDKDKVLGSAKFDMRVLKLRLSSSWL